MSARHKPFRPAPVLLCTVVALLALHGCRRDKDEYVCPSLQAEGDLEVGFAAVSIPWRVGAKPGQVGTHGTPARDAMFARAIGELGDTVFYEPEADLLLENATSWALGRLGERTGEVIPGEYNNIYEAGTGIELPPDIRAMVLKRGGVKVALVRADLYLMHEQLQRRVAELVEKETGLGRDQLFIAATHNHSAPHSVSPAPGVWTLADGFDPRHWVYVTHRIADAIIAADRARRPATLRAARHEFGEVQFNIIGPSTINMAAEEGAQRETIDVGYPRSHFDRDLLVLRFDTPDSDEPLPFLFTFGMHPESLPEGHGITSGDWPRHAEEKLRRLTGVESMWMPGPLGDVEPDNRGMNPEHKFFRGGFDAMDQMSDIIAEAVRDAWTATKEKPAQRRPALSQLAMDVPGPKEHPIPDSSYVAGMRFPMVRILQDATHVRLHAVRIGDALLLGAPAEITTDLAYNMKSRVDDVAGNLYQGYVYPEAPEWVRTRIQNNFTPGEIAPELGAPLPVVVSVVNGYTGYIVSRWEYENRQHYRESLTAYGPGTADFVAQSFLGLVGEIQCVGRFQPAAPDWKPIDDAGVKEIEAYLGSLEDAVRDYARNFPASDPARVGTVLAQPQAPQEQGHKVRFSWVGGTNDMDPPAVRVEAELDGEWKAVHQGPGREIHVLFQAPDTWTAEWFRPELDVAANVRFHVEGVYRGPTAGASTPDPIWDPEGANRSYSVTSEAFAWVP